MADTSSSSITQVAFPESITDTKYDNYKIIFYVASKDFTNEDALATKVAEQDDDSTTQKVANPLETATVDTDDGSIVAQLTLPLPNQISDSQDHTWQQELGLAGTAYNALGQISPGSLLSGFISGKGGKIGNALGQALGSMNFTLDQMSGYIAHEMGYRKPVVNPGYWQNYTGSTPRRFALTYDFVPNSQYEATLIRNIILLFKMYASPSISDLGTLILMAPYYFRIKICNNYVSKLFNMNCVVITNVQVDYGADGSMQLFNDGFPKQITMTLQMAETSLALADNYKNSYSSLNGTDPTGLSNYESALDTLKSAGLSV